MDRLEELAKGHPTEGFWKCYHRLRNMGGAVNHKKLHRIYKKMGMPLRRKTKKRLPARVKEPLGVPGKFTHTWSIDFVGDVLSNGVKFRSFNVIDDYNREVREGCHVTSMAGSWLSVVEGFGGMRVRDGVLSFDPQLPAAWESLSFKVNFRDRVLTVRITRNAVEVANEGAPVELEIRGVRRLIADKVIMNCEL